MRRRSWLLSLLPALAPRAQAANMESKNAPFEGGKVHYESCGSGSEALMFIHGWTCDLTFWRGQAPIYQAHRSLLIDLPGHGESDKPHVAYAAEFFARGVGAVLDDAGVGRAILVGHSMGGPVAYTFLRLFPQRVKALVLVDASLGVTSRDPQYVAEQKLRYAERVRLLTGPSGNGNFLAQVEAMFSPKTGPALREQIRAKMLATPEHVRVAAVTSASQLDPLSAGQTFDIPAIAIQAAQQGTEARAAAMRAILPKLRLEKWERSGHFLMMEDPERFNRSLEEFLAGL